MITGVLCVGTIPLGDRQLCSYEACAMWLPREAMDSISEQSNQVNPAAKPTPAELRMIMLKKLLCRLHVRGTPGRFGPFVNLVTHECVELTTLGLQDRAREWLHKE